MEYKYVCCIRVHGISGILARKLGIWVNEDVGICLIYDSSKLPGFYETNSKTSRNFSFPRRNFPSPERTFIGNDLSSLSPVDHQGLRIRVCLRTGRQRNLTCYYTVHMPVEARKEEKDCRGMTSYYKLLTGDSAFN